VGYDDDKVIAAQYQPQEEGVSRQITAFPFLAIIDTDGTVIYAWAGRIHSVDELVQTLEDLELLGGPTD
jgi:hypothetical protein